MLVSLKDAGVGGPGTEGGVRQGPPHTLLKNSAHNYYNTKAIQVSTALFIQCYITLRGRFRITDQIYKGTAV